MLVSASTTRERLIAGGFFLVTIGVGMTVRTGIVHLPRWWSQVLGTALWAVAVYCAVRVVALPLGARRCAVIALVIALGIEILQLTPIPGRLSQVHPLLRLVFGEVFDPGDLIALGIGVMGAMFVELAGRTIRARASFAIP